jgi:hypothetical protein
MNRRQYVIVVLFSVSLLAVALVPLSGQQGSSYNPWLDYNDDGIIDAYDLQALGQAYGSTGTPLNLPMALKYDSGWMDIHDKQGQNITITPNVGNLETSAWTPLIYGKTTINSPIHQRFFDCPGYIPGWNRTCGGTSYESAYSLVRTSDGGFAIAGNTKSYGVGVPMSNFWLVKTDGSGVTQWNKTYGGFGDDDAYSLVQTSDGGYALAGVTYSYGVGAPVLPNFYLVKADSSGNMIWNKTYGGMYQDEAYSLVQTSDEGYLMAGYTNSYGAGGNDFWLIKTDSAGNTQWNKTYGGTYTDRARSLVQTSDGGYAIAGYTNSYGAGAPWYSNFWLVKTDGSGVTQWNKTKGSIGSDFAYSMVQTSDGGYALAGYTDYYGLGTPTYLNFWLVKTDSSGNTQWSKPYGGTNDDVAGSLVQTSDGGYAIAGYTNSYGAGAPYSDFWLVKTDSAGSLQWDKTYGGVNGDVAGSLVQTSNGGYAIAGYTSSYGVGTPANPNFWLVKTDAFGLIEDLGVGLTITGYTADTLTLYRGTNDPYWNYVRVRIWVTKDMSWQPWQQTYGGANVDVAYSLVQTGDGGYAIAGTTDSYGLGTPNVYLVKTSADGIMQWNRTCGGAYADFAYSLVQTGDGGYALAGCTYSFGVGGADFWLVKTDSAGNALWNKTYGGTRDDYGYSLVQTSDGGYAIAGCTYSYGVGTPTYSNVYLVKTDASGIMQWNKTYGGVSDEWVKSLVQTSEGGYALAGATTSFGVGGADFWLVKTDAAGNALWNRTYGGTNNDYAHSLVQTVDGGYALVGSTTSFGVGGADFWLVKTDALGNLVWNQTYGGTSEDWGYSVIQTADGGYAIAGYTDSFGSGRQAYLVKTDALGNLVWNQTYGGGYDDNCYSMVQTRNGGYAVAGSTCSFGIGTPTYANMYLVKTDTLGLVDSNL